VVSLGLALPASAERPPSLDTLRATFVAKAAATGGDVAIYYENLKTGEKIALRAEERLPAASLIKLPILVELYIQLEFGRLNPKHLIQVRPRDRVGGTGVLQGRKLPVALSVRELSELMVMRSDNVATNVLIDRLTMKAVNERMARMGLKSALLQRKMAVKSERQNWINALDMGRLLSRVASDLIPTPKGYQPIYKVMSAAKPGKKLGGLLPQGVRLARKGGRLPHHMHDAGILQAGGQRVVIVVMIAGFKNKNRALAAIQNIGRAVYDHLIATAK
jgi:beta-lactamase class A